MGVFVVIVNYVFVVIVNYVDLANLKLLPGGHNEGYFFLGLVLAGVGLYYFLGLFDRP